jgi:uncharacterized membrane protein YhaH (DUF805 family)
MGRFRRYFDFGGRATRLDYWRFQLLLVVLSGAAILLALLAIPAAGSLGGLVLAPLLIGFVASLALVV